MKAICIDKVLYDDEVKSHNGYLYSDLENGYIRLYKKAKISVNEIEEGYKYSFYFINNVLYESLITTLLFLEYDPKIKKNKSQYTQLKLDL